MLERNNDEVRAHTWAYCRICDATGTIGQGNFKTEFDEPEICEHRAKFQGLMPDDVIERRGQYGQYRFHYPTLCVHGTGCGGYHSMYFGTRYKLPIIFNGRKFPDQIKDGELAWMIALIQWGYSYQTFDNGAPYPNFCNCDERIRELDDTIKQMQNYGVIESIGEWKLVGGIPSRGICDYKREILTNWMPSPTDEETLKEWVLIKDNPGYCGRGMTKQIIGENRKVVYTFTSTMDSSD